MKMHEAGYGSSWYKYNAQENLMTKRFTPFVHSLSVGNLEQTMYFVDAKKV